METQRELGAPWRSGIQGARANLVPGIILQLAALALVLGFYNLPAIHGALFRLMAVRKTYGYALSVVTTALFGGFIPFLVLHFASRGIPDAAYSWAQGLGLTSFWAYKGFEIDFWYHLQALFFGNGHDPHTIVIKVFMDQLVYCPVLAVPMTTAVYELVDSHGNWRAVGADIRAPHWYLRKVLPILISNLGVWVPAVAVIYCLPTPLQLPLNNIVMCFYTLVVIHQTKSAARSAGPGGLAGQGGQT
ncbi:MAG TPA: hypothetical protein VGG34_04455 [Opitutaceae bacterium]|jgi:hypothetical protein